jgi:hypothetical protein
MDARPSFFKDAVAISISIIALVVSLLSAYFNLVWAKDDIGVELGHYPGLFFSGRILTAEGKPYSTELGVSPAQSFTFINNGTRAASIVSIEFFIRSVRTLDTKKKDCAAIDEKSVLGTQGQGYALEPFAIKPGEIIIKTFRLGKPEEKAVWFEPEFDRENNSMDARVYACIEFGIITPGRNLRHVAKVVSLREEKQVQELVKQDSESFGIGRDIQRGPWPRGALIPLINETHFFGPFETANPDAADYGIMGCACGDQHPVMESYRGEREAMALAAKNKSPGKLDRPLKDAPKK